ncbi:MAG: nitrile hydratase accessory protein [Acidimicrobiia bacterium]
MNLDVAGPAAPPRSNGELVFTEPWESRAFGLAVTLHAGGAFEWEDFRQQLIAAVGRWEAGSSSVGDTPGPGPGSDGWSYYACWLEALERVLDAEGVVEAAAVAVRAGELAARPADHGHRHDNHGHDHHDHHDHDGGA